MTAEPGTAERLAELGREVQLAKAAVQQRVGTRPGWFERAEHQPGRDLDALKKLRHQLWVEACGEPLNRIWRNVYRSISETKAGLEGDLIGIIALKLRDVVMGWDPEGGPFHAYAMKALLRELDIEVGRALSPHTLSRNEARSLGREAVTRGRRITQLADRQETDLDD